ncbi:polyprenyl synthetase family protein [Enterococcus casseliflavus]|uniref:polyprenyl synthetase family protein n=1 Tax=Enterococcus casseliflavus TaxID=37734 RepID=UPI0018848E73|nr:polyprenyl synthetase family protein [Enterococcus casseliflavus]MBE9908966.1 hypothetical protein [Enterococcus casseliflavus]
MNNQDSFETLSREYAQAVHKYLNNIKNVYSKDYFEILQKNLLIKNKESFSLGVLFLLLNSLSETDYFEVKFDLAVELEVIFVASNLIDDIVDEDDENLLSANELLINSLSLLFKTIYKLYDLTKDTLEISIVLKFLNQSIEGEVFDFYSTMTESTTIKKYFSEMLKKSTSLIQLVCYVACPTFPEIWNSFAEFLGNAFQIQDDSVDSLNIEKADIKKHKETLPMIKVTEYAKLENNEAIIDIIKHKRYDCYSSILLTDYIKNSGALEFSLNVSTLYAEKAFQILRDVFISKESDVEMIVKYLKEG